MRVTVCELPDEPQRFVGAFELLVEHCRVQQSELVVLPEMPFAAWAMRAPHFDATVWRAAVATHAEWLVRLDALAPATVVSTRPVDYENSRKNEVFARCPGDGAGSREAYAALHHKHFLPDEPGFWEASWYERGGGEFGITRVGSAHIGAMVCTELWFFEHARAYGKRGVHIVTNPRATGRGTVDKWLAAGRVAAVVSGAFNLSANRVSDTQTETDSAMGGQGWIIDHDGNVLAVTSAAQPFVTRDIDLSLATEAKHTYPRYVVSEPLQPL